MSSLIRSLAIAAALSLSAAASVQAAPTPSSAEAQGYYITTLGRTEKALTSEKAAKLEQINLNRGKALSEDYPILNRGKESTTTKPAYINLNRGKALSDEYPILNRK